MLKPDSDLTLQPLKKTCCFPKGTLSMFFVSGQSFSTRKKAMGVEVTRGKQEAIITLRLRSILMMFSLLAWKHIPFTEVAFIHEKNLQPLKKHSF